MDTSRLRSKKWYQKGVVQASLIAGVFSIGTVWMAHTLRQSEVPQLRSAYLARNEPSAGVLPKPISRAVESSVITSLSRPEANAGPSTRSTVAARPTSVFSSDVLDLQDGKPTSFAKLNAFLTASFRETLDTKYVEIMIALPGQPPLRFPARHPGALGRFSVGKNAAYQITLLSVDWEARRVQALVDHSS
jgi:predicted transcriptional regulator